MGRLPLVIYQVSDLIGCLNQTLDTAYPLVEVEGEVAEYKVSQNKWVYFNIKDKSSTIKCFMPIWQLRTPIEDGMVIIVRAKPKITNWGSFSLTVNSLKLAGEGDIKKSFDILKARLEVEGLFRIDRKRPLPMFPKNIAVISSVQAAGYADFIKIINERWGGVRVQVANVQVQGEAAADQIIRAINFLNQKQDLPEVIVIIRGGGGADDLAVFNDEKLVRAILASRVPTLVGVGHETDQVLAGLVADVEASTPSNAASIIVPDKLEIIRSHKNQLASLLARLERSVNKQVESNKLLLSRFLDSYSRQLSRLISQLDNYKIVINQLNPNNILKRGYSIIRGDIRAGSIIDIESINKLIKAEVKNVKSK